MDTAKEEAPTLRAFVCRSAGATNAVGQDPAGWRRDDATAHARKPSGPSPGQDRGDAPATPGQQPSDRWRPSLRCATPPRASSTTVKGRPPPPIAQRACQLGAGSQPGRPRTDRRAGEELAHRGRSVHRQADHLPAGPPQGGARSGRARHSSMQGAPGGPEVDQRQRRPRRPASARLPPGGRTQATTACRRRPPGGLHGAGCRVDRATPGPAPTLASAAPPASSIQVLRCITPPPAVQKRRSAARSPRWVMPARVRLQRAAQVVGSSTDREHRHRLAQAGTGDAASEQHVCDVAPLRAAGWLPTSKRRRGR